MSGTVSMNAVGTPSHSAIMQPCSLMNGFRSLPILSTSASVTVTEGRSTVTALTSPVFTSG